MAHAKKRVEKIIELPGDVLDKLNGFAIDFGGSVIKLAYLSKEDWKKDQMKDIENHNRKLRLTSFAREELDECFDFIKENCFIRRKSEGDRPLVYTCGIGGFQYGKKIEDSLNVRTQNENKMDGFKYTMQYYLNNYPLDTFCVKPNTEVQKAALTDLRKMRSRFRNMLDEGMIDQNRRIKEGVEEIMERQYDPTANTKPYILASFGSAWVCLRCDENNMFSSCGFNVFAGRSFLGLGALLTGAKTYEELMALAEKGNNLNLDITFKDITEEGKENSGQKEKNDDDIYGKVMKDMIPRPVFLWGKAVQSSLENFKKEDLAKTLLYTMCQELVRTAINAMHMTRTKHLFVAGSFISHSLTQRLVEEEFEYARWGGAMYYDGIDGDYHLHILDFGSHFGAIGSFMNGPKRTDSMRKKAQEEQP